MDISAMAWAVTFPSTCTHPDGAAVVLAKVLVELAGLARHLGADRVALVIALDGVVLVPVSVSERRWLSVCAQQAAVSARACMGLLLALAGLGQSAGCAALAGLVFET